MTLNVDDRAAGDGNGVAHSRRLAELAATGDHDAWELIYRAVYPRLRAYAVRHVGHHAAEDLVSETMTRAIRGIDGFRWTAAGIEPWLFGIARRARRRLPPTSRTPPSVVRCRRLAGRDLADR